MVVLWLGRIVCMTASGIQVNLAAHATNMEITNMSIYLTRARYSQEAFKAMTAKPEDREVAAKAMFAAANIKLHHMWYSANGEVICVVEGTAVAGAAVSMVVLASGSFTSVESIELITMGQMVEAMGSAGAVAAKFRPPGK